MNLKHRKITKVSMRVDRMGFDFRSKCPQESRVVPISEAFVVEWNKKKKKRIKEELKNMVPIIFDDMLSYFDKKTSRLLSHL